MLLGHWYPFHLRETVYQKTCHFQRAFEKDGENSFQFTILEEITKDKLDNCERSWIKQYQSNHREHGYNFESGGHELKEHSEETKLKIAKAHIGMKNSPEARAKISEANRHRVYSAETKKKLSDAAKANNPMKREDVRRKFSLACQNRVRTPLSQETRAKLSAVNKGRVRDPENRRNISNGLKKYHAEQKLKGDKANIVRDYHGRFMPSRN